MRSYRKGVLDSPDSRNKRALQVQRKTKVPRMEEAFSPAIDGIQLKHMI